jgi:hypothetical protein
MASLSKLVASWLYTKPGPIYGLTTDEVFENVRAIIANHMQIAPTMIDLPLLEHTFDMLGYRPVQRQNHGPTAERPDRFYWILALPER